MVSSEQLGRYRDYALIVACASFSLVMLWFLVVMMGATFFPRVFD